MKIINSYREAEAIELEKLGKMMPFLDDIRIESNHDLAILTSWENHFDLAILTSWENHFESVGSPYLVVKVWKQNGVSKRRAAYQLLKERRV
jgi:hypothetical protein